MEVLLVNQQPIIALQDMTNGIRKIADTEATSAWLRQHLPIPMLLANRILIAKAVLLPPPSIADLAIMDVKADRDKLLVQQDTLNGITRVVHIILAPRLPYQKALHPQHAGNVL
jgi:hypothetical protein